MITKTVILLFAALLTAQVSTKAAPQPRDLIDTALDIASAALKGISAAIDAGLQFVEQALEHAISDADKIQQQIVNATDVLLDGVLKELSREIERIKSNTSEAGIDIVDCAEAANSSIKASGDKAVNATAGCIVTLYQEVLLNFNGVIGDLQKKNDEIKVYEDQITECKNASNVLTCVIEDVENIIKNVTTIGEDVQSDIKKAADSIEELTKTAETCVTPNTAALDKDIESIFTVFASCVQDKLSTSFVF